MDAVVAHAVENPTRVAVDPKFRAWGRCGVESETPRHGFWECPENANMESDDVLCKTAQGESWDRDSSCDWNGGYGVMGGVVRIGCPGAVGTVLTKPG